MICPRRLAVVMVLFSTLMVPSGDRGVIAACPVTQYATPISLASADYDHCVLRPERSSDGDYLVAFADINASYYGTAYGFLYDENHSFLDNVTAGSSMPQMQGIDAVGRFMSYSSPWTISWVRGAGDAADPQFRRLDTALDTVYPGAENVLTMTHSGMRGDIAAAVLPQTQRLVHVQSIRSFISACSATEWRTRFNLRDSSLNDIVPNALASSACSSYPFDTSVGQEHPDVSASWLLSDYFVVTWYDRTDCNVYARTFNASGAPITGDILIAQADLTCGGARPDRVAPRVAAIGEGYMVVWTRTDGTLWMRTFDLLGTPYGAAQLVPSSYYFKGANIDIDAVYADPCDQGAEPYFAISWWQRSLLLRNGRSYWQPNVSLVKGLANPVNAIPGYMSLGGPSDVQVSYAEEPAWDRVSVSFFPSACPDPGFSLTLGTAWTSGDDASAIGSEIWTRFVRFNGVACQQGRSSTSEDGGVRSPDADLSLEEARAKYQDDPNVVVFAVAPRSDDEPPAVYPPEEPYGDE